MTPEQLKASILKYAMQGKLVEQKPEDGTGEDLFCKMQQVSTPNKNVTPIVEEEIPFDLRGFIALNNGESPSPGNL